MQGLFHPETKDIALSKVLFALSDPIRLRMVARLDETGSEFTCGELQPDGMAKSSISHHFKVLRESGVIRTRLEGTCRYVSLRTEDLESRLPGLLTTVLALIHSEGITRTKG